MNCLEDTMTNGQALIEQALSVHGDRIWPLVHKALSDCPAQRDLVALLEVKSPDRPDIAVATRPNAIRALSRHSLSEIANILTQRNGVAAGADHVLHVVLVTDQCTVVSSVQFYPPMRAIGDA